MKVIIPKEVYQLLDIYRDQGATESQIESELQLLLTDQGHLISELDFYDLWNKEIVQ